MLNFKLHQKETLTRLLHLQSPHSAFQKAPGSNQSDVSNSTVLSSPILNTGSFATQWKVLILDTLTRSIIGPLFTLPQLKEEGVTLHLSITQPRELVRGVPAVYFVAPTANNITSIIADLNKQLYDEYYINFTSIPQGFLEQFATRLAAECINPEPQNLIKQVNNAMCEFICLEDNCITLGHKQSYLSLYSPTVTEASVRSYIETIGDNLLTMIYQVYINSNGSLPYLYLPKSPYTPSHVIGKYICQQLPKVITQNSPNGATSQLPKTSPLIKRWRLLIVDRHFNMGSQFMQNLQYSSLIYDLGFNHGQIALPSQSTEVTSSTPSINTTNSTNSTNSTNTTNTATTTTTTISIDNTDTFWLSNRYKILPEVTETVHNTTLQYKNEITRINNIMAMSANNTSSSSTSDYNSIISTLPLLTKKKAQLDAHYSVCSTLVSTVSQRQIHKSWPLELNMLASHFKFAHLSGPGTANQQVDTPATQKIQDLVKFLTVAHQHATTAATQDLSSSPSTGSEQYTGSLTPFDRLRLIAMLTLSGFPLGSNQLHTQTYSQLVQGLKSTCTDKRYIPLYHVSQQQIEHVLQFCRALHQTLSMQQQGSNTPQSPTNTSSSVGSALGKFASNLFGGSDKPLIPLAEIALNTSHFTIVNSPDQGQNAQHSASMLLVDPLGLQANPLPTPQVLQTLETFTFVVGAGNWTEYMNLCGDYSNFTYVPQESLPIGSGAGRQLAYDQATQQKHRQTVGITCPNGLVYGSTEMTTTRELFEMIDALITEEKKQKSSK